MSISVVMYTVLYTSYKSGFIEIVKSQTPSTRFRATQLIAPVSFITIGALGVGERAPLRSVSVAVDDKFREWSAGKRPNIYNHMLQTFARCRQIAFDHIYCSDELQPNVLQYSFQILIYFS